jgi:hypothetical protein
MSTWRLPQVLLKPRQRARDVLFAQAGVAGAGELVGAVGESYEFPLSAQVLSLGLDALFGLPALSDRL